VPGIVGLITKSPKLTAELQLRQMVKVMCHETFYVAGTWTDEELGVYVGWVARKGSFADGMPLRNERGDVVMAFAGEEFPDPGLRAGLRQKGHEVGDAGPAYLVHSYEESLDFPRPLNGRFHGLVADKRNGTVLLFNDRYGMERLYWHQSKDAFYFAAEAKAILAVCPELRSLDARGLGEYISCGAVLENRSLFTGIEIFPPASAWRFWNAALERKVSYFQPKEWEEQGILNEESFYSELREAFTGSLPKYLRGSEPVAMSLTGGLDTRMIMAWQRSQPGTLPCYTFGSMYHENQDVRVARRVAQVCSQPFQVLTAGREFLSNFSGYAKRTIYLGEGGVDLSRSGDLYLSEKVRQIAPVRLTGDYGGEILRRISTFKASMPFTGLYSPDILPQIHRAEETLGEVKKIHPLSFTVFKQAPWDYRGVVGLEETQFSNRTPYFDNEIVRTVFRAPASILASSGTSVRLISDGSKELAAIPTDRGVGGNQGALMGAARRAFLEFQFKAEYAYDMGMPQWVAHTDRALSALQLERLFLGRHKVFHFRTWYRNALSGYVREMLLDSHSLARPYIEKKVLESIVVGHVTGNRNYTNEIHKVLTLELIHRLFIDTAVLLKDHPIEMAEAVATSASHHPEKSE
jgi:asparagine synthase (glutamine-hydrolysing)